MGGLNSVVLLTTFFQPLCKLSHYGHDCFNHSPNYDTSRHDCFNHSPSYHTSDVIVSATLQAMTLVDMIASTTLQAMTLVDTIVSTTLYAPILLDKIISTILQALTRTTGHDYFNHYPGTHTTIFHRSNVVFLQVTLMTIFPLLSPTPNMYNC